MPKPKPQQKVKQIYIEIDPKILRRFKGLAAQAGKPVQKLLGDLVQYWVKSQNNKEE